MHARPFERTEISILQLRRQTFIPPVRSAFHPAFAGSRLQDKAFGTPPAHHAAAYRIPRASSASVLRAVELQICCARSNGIAPPRLDLRNAEPRRSQFERSFGAGRETGLNPPASSSMPAYLMTVRRASCRRPGLTRQRRHIVAGNARERWVPPRAWPSASDNVVSPPWPRRNHCAVCPMRRSGRERPSEARMGRLRKASLRAAGGHIDSSSPT